MEAITLLTSILPYENKRCLNITRESFKCAFESNLIFTNMSTNDI